MKTHRLVTLVAIGLMVIQSAGYGQLLTTDLRPLGRILINDRFTGSGCVAFDPTLVLTCAHILNDNATVSFESLEGKTFPVKIIYVNPAQDIAILKSDTPIYMEPYTFADTFSLLLEEPIFYGGYDKDEGAFKFARTKVESIGATAVTGRLVDYFEFNSIGKNGFSGGPIVNSDGKLVGILTEGWDKVDLDSPYRQRTSRARLLYDLFVKMNRRD